MRSEKINNARESIENETRREGGMWREEATLVILNSSFWYTSDW